MNPANSALAVRLNRLQFTPRGLAQQPPRRQGALKPLKAIRIQIMHLRLTLKPEEFGVSLGPPPPDAIT